MSRKRRAVTLQQLAALENAVKFLRMARESTRHGGARNAGRYLARASKSLQGALNHARGVWQRQLAEYVEENNRE